MADRVTRATNQQDGVAEAAERFILQRSAVVPR